MRALTTTRNSHLSDLIIASALQSGTYCCGSWTYTILHTDVSKKENAHSRNYGPFKTKNKKHDPKLIKNIQIEVFSDTSLFLSITYSLPNDLVKQNLNIDRAAFELWLYQTGRLDWCLTVIDHKLLTQTAETQYGQWFYGKYGVTVQDLHTYLLEHRNKL